MTSERFKRVAAALEQPLCDLHGGGHMQAWRIDVLARPDQLDPIGEAAQRTLSAAELRGVTSVRSRRGYLLSDQLTREQVERFAAAVLCDPVIEQTTVHAPGAQPPQPVVWPCAAACTTSACCWKAMA